MTPAQRIASSMTKAHKRISRLVGLTLMIADDHDPQPFLQLIAALRLSLTPWERKALAWAACYSCDDQDVADIVDSVLPPQAGPPGPPFDPSDVERDAAFWVDQASDLEIRTYGLAILATMTPRERENLLAIMKRAGL